MQYVLLGFAVLALGLLATNGFVRANPAVLARFVRTAGGVAALSGAAILVVRGAMNYAIPLAMLGSWLLSSTGGGLWRGRGGGRGQPQGQSSRVVTDHLELELDHDTGTMRGRILKGVFKGRDIDGMAPAEMALLWHDCRFADPQSAQLIEAYLDRIHPTWREDMARAEGESGPGGRMTRDEALDILGLKPGAGEDDVRRAHRELMQRMHPDHGGSGYLAAKINEAKDVLLGK